VGRLWPVKIDAPSGLEAASSELEGLKAGYRVCTTLQNVGAHAYRPLHARSTLWRKRMPRCHVGQKRT